MRIIAVSGGFLLDFHTSLQFSRTIIGADCCFLKPIDMTKLHSIVDEYAAQIDE